MATRAIDMVIRARDEASAVVGKVEQRVKRFGGGAGGAAGEAGNAFQRWGTAVMRIGAAVQIANVGIKTVAAVTSLIKGDYEGMELVIRRLPMGIGEIAGTMTDWLRGLRGVNAELAAFQAKLTEQDAFAKDMDRRRKAKSDALSRFAALQDAAERQAETAGLSPIDKQRYAVHKEFADRVRAANAEVAKGVGVTASDAAKVIAAAHVAFEAQMDALKQAPADEQARARQSAGVIESRFLHGPAEKAAEETRKSTTLLGKIADLTSQQLDMARRQLEAVQAAGQGGINEEFAILEINE